MSRNQTKWDQKTHEDILIAMVEYYNPTTADAKEIVELLRYKYTFTGGALL